MKGAGLPSVQLPRNPPDGRIVNDPFFVKGVSDAALDIMLIAELLVDRLVSHLVIARYRLGSRTSASANESHLRSGTF